MTTLFISDLHLDPSRPAVNDVFFRFLNTEARQGQALYILGDLFEAWAGDDDVEDPLHAEVCAQLRSLAQAGVRTYFLHGNRDLLVGEKLAAAAGFTLLRDPTLVDIEGTPTLLMHGDTLCTDDIEYQKIRAQLHNSAWQQVFLSHPLAARKQQIALWRQQSEQAKAGKAAEIMDVNPDAVAAAMRSHGYPRLIHGHTHRPARHVCVIDGRECERWVLHDWYGGGSYLEVTPAGCRDIALS